jgi:hypothetical protein
MASDRNRAAHSLRAARSLGRSRQAAQQPAARSKGRYLEGRRYYDDEGDECLDLEDRSADATIVTHWRPLPGAPVERA